MYTGIFFFQPSIFRYIWESKSRIKYSKALTYSFTQERYFMNLFQFFVIVHDEFQEEMFKININYITLKSSFFLKRKHKKPLFLFIIIIIISHKSHNVHLLRDNRFFFEYLYLELISSYAHSINWKGGWGRAEY